MIEQPDLTEDGAAPKLAALGGPAALKDGTWFFRLVRHSLRAYARNGNAGYFRAKYPSMPDAKIAAKLISVAARNAGLIGGTSGAVMSANEIAALATLGASAPGWVLAAAGIGADIVSVTHLQVRLIAALAALYGAPLDPDDPEDVLTAIGYFMKATSADAFGSAAMKMGGYGAQRKVKQVFSKETLKATQKLASKVGVKVLQGSLVKVAVPVASIGIGAVWNYIGTKAIGRHADAGMRRRAEELRQWAAKEDEVAEQLIVVSPDVAAESAAEPCLILDPDDASVRFVLMPMRV
jgi:uncharacterized protein (DUF697 family)